MNQELKEIETKVQSFWQWFIEMEDDIQEYFAEEDVIDKAALVEALDDKILDFGLFAWEIGPGTAAFYLTISPNGSKARLEISKLIIQSAPPLPAWELNYARPAKGWNLKFSLHDDFMVEREVDASEWKYVLLKHSEKKVVIILQADNVNDLDHDTQLIAGGLAVDSLLGEEAKINYVYRIDVVNELEEQHKPGRSPISGLRQHLEELVQ